MTVLRKYMKKVIIITGGSRGIGAATAFAAAEKGYAVGLNYLENKKAADEVIQKIHQRGGTAKAVPGDVSCEKDVLHLFDTVENEFGPITALVNNAGIIQQQTNFKEISLERWQTIFAVNVTGSFFVRTGGCEKNAFL